MRLRDELRILAIVVGVALCFVAVRVALSRPDIET